MVAVWETYLAYVVFYVHNSGLRIWNFFFFFLLTLFEACFIFQSASPSPRNSSSHCILLLLYVCLGGTLTDSDGSLGKMQLGISWAEHASTSVFAFIRVHNQEFAFNTVWTFRWKSEIERMLLEACLPLHITGFGKGGLAFWGSPVLRGEAFSCWSPWWSETQTRMWGLMRDWACSQVCICRHVWVCCVYQLCGGSTIKETEQER